MTTKLRIFLYVFCVALPLDQLSKAWIASHLRQNFDRIPVIDGYFYITHVRNPGAAFGILQGGPEFLRVGFFIAVSILASILVLSFFRGLRAEDRYTSFCLGMIFSGAIGNLIDRLRFQEVIDFLHFRLWGNYSWPDFNVADSCIVVGVSLLALQLLFATSEPTSPPEVDSQ